MLTDLQPRPLAAPPNHRSRYRPERPPRTPAALPCARPTAPTPRFVLSPAPRPIRGASLQDVQAPVARQAIAYGKAKAPHCSRLTGRKGKPIRHRFWQPGGGSDRNLTTAAAWRALVAYLPANPVRRGLGAQRPRIGNGPLRAGLRGRAPGEGTGTQGSCWKGPALERVRRLGHA